MGDTSLTTITNNHTPKEIALGRLLVAAGQGNASKVIGAYQPELAHEQNIKALEKFTVESYLKPCAEFLGIPATLSTGILKADLCDLIILYIESFFPIDCSACSQSYTVDIEAESGPLLSCLICHQGSHDCNAMMEKAKRFIELANEIPSGCAWICSACFKKNHHSSTGRHTTPPPSFEPIGTKQNDPILSELQSKRETAGVCPLYKLGTCPHGISGNRVHQDVKCQYLHPKRCKPFCRNGPQHQYGCSKGLSCPKFHPTLCTGSLSSKECYNESCTSTHLRRTRRKRQSSKSGYSKPRPNNSNVNKRVPPRQSESRTNISRQPQLQTKPDTPNTLPELTFLVNTVQTMMQEITTLKRDMIRSGHTHPSPHHLPHPLTSAPPHQPSYQPANQHAHPSPVNLPAPAVQTPCYPPGVFNSQTPVMLTQQQIRSSQPPPSTPQPPQPFQMSRLLSY